MSSGSSPNNDEVAASGSRVTEPGKDESSPGPSSSPSKRPVSANEADAALDVPAKRARISSSTDDSRPETGRFDDPLDLAVTLGFSPGDRIEVKWEVEPAVVAARAKRAKQNLEKDEDQGGQEQPENEDTGNEDDTDDSSGVFTRWWGATLLEHDGRTEDSVAVRVLQYDPYPEGGFPDSSFEDVIFMGQDLLVSPDSRIQLNYRREADKDTEPVIWYNENDLHEQLNTILMSALQNHQNVWKTLPPAKQAAIAEKIAIKKEKLISVLKGYDAVITSASIHEILQQAFG